MIRFDWLVLAFHKPYDLSIEGNRSRERNRRIALTSLVSIVEKVITTAIPLITIRITYDYLGVEVYGLWSAVTNFFALFSFSDLGLGNGLQTKLSQASGKNDIALCKKLLSSTNFILSSIASLLLVLFLLLYPFVDWAKLMNATEYETIQLAAPVVLVIVLPRILMIPTAIIGRTQYALQEGYITHLWGIASSVLSLLLIYLISSYDLGKLVLLASASVVPLLISAINIFYYYGKQRVDLRFPLFKIDKRLSQGLLKLGISFCVLSVFTTIGLSMDTFIVAKTCTLSDAASFSILYKISLVISGVLAVFAQPLWGANGEAFARGDVDWVKRNTKRMSYIMTVMTIVGTLGLLIFSKWFFRIWIGESFVFSQWCLFWMCLMQVFQAFISPYFMIMNARGVVIPQIVVFAVFTIISFILKFLLVKIWGISAIPAVGAICYLFFIVLSIRYLSMREFRMAL